MMVLEPQVFDYLAGKVESKFNLRKPIGKILVLTSEVLKTGSIIYYPKCHRHFWRMILIMRVSYTHLDVYKRQN